MADSVLQVLKNLEETSQKQLASARRLDVSGLNEATQRRQDLLFELQLLSQDKEQDTDSDDVRASIERLRVTDDRLARIVQSVLSLLAAGDGHSPPELYGADGRLNG